MAIYICVEDHGLAPAHVMIYPTTANNPTPHKQGPLIKIKYMR